MTRRTGRRRAGSRLGASYLSLKLRQNGITPRAGRNSARLALAADLPTSVLAEFTGTSISNATRCTGDARRDWFNYIAELPQRFLMPFLKLRGRWMEQVRSTARRAGEPKEH